MSSPHGSTAALTSPRRPDRLDFAIARDEPRGLPRRAVEDLTIGGRRADCWCRRIMRTPSIMILLASSVLLSLAACGDDPSIVATWRELPNAFDEEPTPEAERATWTFGEDGIVTHVENGDTETATYTIDGDRLTLSISDADETIVVETRIVLTDDRLVYGALFPDGEVDGPVGQWHATSKANEDVIDTRLIMRADRTAVLSQKLGDDPETVFDTGTWEQQGDSMRLVFTTGSGSTLTTRMHLLDGEAVGSMLERL
jgi:hypothetical protein